MLKHCHFFQFRSYPFFGYSCVETHCMIEIGQQTAADGIYHAVTIAHRLLRLRTFYRYRILSV
jgi:hypothetical protein